MLQWQLEMALAKTYKREQTVISYLTSHSSNTGFDRVSIHIESMIRIWLFNDK
jgi:hypothetical protein